MLIAVNRGRGQRVVLPPRPSSPLPMLCPRRRVAGRLPCFNLLSLGHICLSEGTKGEGTRRQGKVKGGRES